MKYILILLFVSSNVMAQKDTLITLPMQDGKVFYQKVIEDSGQTKDQLFIKAKDVFLRSFPSTKDVIQDADKESGIISGKGNFDLKSAVIRFTLRILTKDSKYKVEMFDFYANDYPVEYGYSVAQKKQRGQKSWKDFNNTVQNIFDQIERDMNKKTDF